MIKTRNVKKGFTNTNHPGPLAASCQLVNTWVLGSILEVPLKSWYLYFLPNTPETTTVIWLGDRGWNAMESPWKTRSQLMPREFTTHDTASSQSSHYNHLSNPSLMYSRTYMNLYDAIGSVILCEKLHKHLCFHWIAMAACFIQHGNGIPIWGSLLLIMGPELSK